MSYIYFADAGEDLNVREITLYHSGAPGLVHDPITTPDSCGGAIDTGYLDDRFSNCDCEDTCP